MCILQWQWRFANEGRRRNIPQGRPVNLLHSARDLAASAPKPPSCGVGMKRVASEDSRDVGIVL